MEQKTDNETFLQLIFLTSGIIRRITEKGLDNIGRERFNMSKPEQCAETGAKKS